MLSWPQRKEKVPPSPIPGAAEGLGGPAVDALREPAVNSFPHTTHVSHANMQATLPELVDCSNQLSLRHTYKTCQYAGNTGRCSQLLLYCGCDSHKEVCMPITNSRECVNVNDLDHAH